MNLTTAWTLTRDTFKEWSQDNVSRLAAALAYYTVFSVAPLLVVLISVIGMVVGRFVGQEKAHEVVFDQLRDLMGPDSASVVGKMVESASATGTGWAMIVGIALLLYG